MMPYSSAEVYCINRVEEYVRKVSNKQNERLEGTVLHCDLHGQQSLLWLALGYVPGFPRVACSSTLQSVNFYQTTLCVRIEDSVLHCYSLEELSNPTNVCCLFVSE